MDPNTDVLSLISQKAVIELTTLSRVEIYRRIKAGTFPAPVRLSVNKIAFHKAEVLGWIAAQRRVPHAPTNQPQAA